MNTLPNWPGLMDGICAREYLGGIGEDQFRSLVAKYGVFPRALGFRRKLWRQSDLEQLLALLPADEPHGPEVPPDEPDDLFREAHARVQRKRKGKLQ